MELDAPAPYKAALGDVPLFYLPWPIELLPQEGAEVSLSGFSPKYSDITIDNVMYMYSRESGVTAYAEAKWDVDQIDIYALLNLSEEGFLVETVWPNGERLSVEELLRKAGLATTTDEYQKQI